jgi:hypothetical protein
MWRVRYIETITYIYSDDQLKFPLFQNVLSLHPLTEMVDILLY